MGGIVLLSLIYAFATVSSQYDHSLGNEAIYYALGAFCEKSSIETWTSGIKLDAYYNLPSSVKQFEIFEVIETESNVLHAFIGFDTSKSRIVLSFRGSDNFENWMSNINFALSPYPNGQSVSNAKVHPGFYQAFKDLESAGLAGAIFDAFAERPSYDEILVTGHSLGGALAGIAALELKQSSIYNSLSNKHVNVITFGSPRWCNHPLANLYNDVIDTNWRIVNRYDIVSTLPPGSMHYRHVGTQIWYNYERWWWDMNPIEYKVCDGSGEDSNCFGAKFWWDRIAQVHHHLEYFDLDWITDDDKC